MITLRSVRDTRDGREHSVVIVSSRKTKYFVPIEVDE